MSLSARVLLLMLLINTVVSGAALAAGRPDVGYAGFPIALLISFLYLRRRHPVGEPRAEDETEHWDWRPMMVALSTYSVVLTLLVALAFPIPLVIFAALLAGFWARRRYEHAEENKSRE